MKAAWERESVRLNLLLRVIDVADDMTRDGCVDRQYDERKDLVTLCTAPIWADISPDTLVEVWLQAQRHADDCVSVVAQRVLSICSFSGSRCLMPSG